MEAPEVFDTLARSPHFDRLCQVGACREVLRTTRQDDGARSRIGLCAARGGGDLVHALDRQGIAAFGAIERDDETCPIALNLQGIEWHGSRLLPCILGPIASSLRTGGEDIKLIRSACLGPSRRTLELPTANEAAMTASPTRRVAVITGGARGMGFAA